MNDASALADLDGELQKLRERTFTRDDAEAFLKGFGGYLEVELEFDENGLAEIEVDDDIRVGLLHMPTLPGIVVMSPLDEEVAGRPDLMVALLQANLSMAATQGGCFATIPPIKSPVLCRLVLPQGEDYEKFDQEMAEFLALVETWTEQLDAALLAPAESEDEEPAPGGGGGDEPPPGSIRV